MTIETIIPVRFPDCDSMGIVHHAIYPVYYEAARFDVFNKCCFDYEATHSLGIDPALVHLEVDYGAPVKFPCNVVVKTRIVILEGKKIAFRYELFKEGDSSPCGKAYSFHIWVRDGKSIDLEKEVPQAFEAYKKILEVE